MAITKTDILTGTNTFICDVTKTVDADTTFTFAHGLNENGAPKAPLIYIITSIASSGAASTAATRWYVSAVTATDITIISTTTAGTGSPTPQIRVILMLPQTSII